MFDSSTKRPRMGMRHPNSFQRAEPVEPDPFANRGHLKYPGDFKAAPATGVFPGALQLPNSTSHPNSAIHSSQSSTPQPQNWPDCGSYDRNRRESVLGSSSSFSAPMTPIGSTYSYNGESSGMSRRDSARMVEARFPPAQPDVRYYSANSPPSTVPYDCDAEYQTFPASNGPDADTQGAIIMGYGRDGLTYFRKRRGNLPKEATRILKRWFDSHLDSPYPTEDEKRALVEETRLDINQVANWFINARRRRKDKRPQSDGHRPFSREPPSPAPSIGMDTTSPSPRSSFH